MKTVSKILGSIVAPALRFFPGTGLAAVKNNGPKLACDFGKTEIILLEMSSVSDKLSVQRFCKVKRALEKDQEAAALLKKAFEEGGFSTSRVRLSMKGQGLIIRFLQFPKMKREDLRSAISFEIEQYIPFKSNEVVWDFHILEESADGKLLQVLLVAAKREEVENLIQTIQLAGLQIELLDVDALAMINAYKKLHPAADEESVVLLDIDTEISTLCVLQKGIPRFIRDISYGRLDIIKRIRRKLGMTEEQAHDELDHLDKASPESLQVIKEAMQEFLLDVKVSLSYYSDQIPNSEPVQKIYVAGTDVRHRFVTDLFQSSLGLTVEILNFAESLSWGPQVTLEQIRGNEGLLPVAIGLCVRDL